MPRIAKMFASTMFALANEGDEFPQPSNVQLSIHPYNFGSIFFDFAVHVISSCEQNTIRR
jgi:hypothetical protein